MSNESGTEPKSRKKTWIVVGLLAVVVLAVTGGMYWYTQVSVPHEAAIAEFDEAAASYDAAVPGLEVKNDALTTKITELENLTNSGRQPLDPDLLQSSGALIGEAQASVVDVPAMPIRAEEARSSSTEEIREYTAQLREITSQITSVEPPDAMVAQVAAATIELENSMRQMEQVTNPSEQFVIARLTGLPTITGVQAATEENDPNGQLNKQGGYTAAVFFSSDLVDRSRLTSDGDIVAVATDGGGSVEVYPTVDLAEAREKYLAGFDGTVFASGSHHVLGTCVVRVSNLLTASEQESIRASIADSLTRLG